MLKLTSGGGGAGLGLRLQARREVYRNGRLWGSQKRVWCTWMGEEGEERMISYYRNQGKSTRISRAGASAIFGIRWVEFRVYAPQ
jgi:hypothetical protein